MPTGLSYEKKIEDEGRKSSNMKHELLLGKALRRYWEKIINMLSESELKWDEDFQLAIVAKSQT